MSRIALENVSMIYRAPRTEPVHALTDVSYCFEAGKSYAITGESGSGKSTLLNIIAGILRPTSGKAMVMGSDWAVMSDAKQCRMRCAHVGLVVQDFALIEQITVLENCLLAAVLNQQSRKAGLLRANELLETLGLTAFRKTKACYLSGGQRQRVAIARALMNRPEILLADEPTGALDSATSMQVVRTLLKSTEGERTLIMVTHNTTYASLCDHRLSLRDGVLDICPG